MNVRVVRVLVRERLVAMPMRVWLGTVPRERMRMPMVRVVVVQMGMVQRLMGMRVFVALAQV